jgi:uncharacterized membrane protein
MFTPIGHLVLLGLLYLAIIGAGVARWSRYRGDPRQRLMTVQVFGGLLLFAMWTSFIVERLYYRHC